MGYTPTTWNTGDTITASALNKIEQGIAEGGGSAMVIGVITTGDESSAFPIMYNTQLDKTFEEIYNALAAGTPVFVKAVFALDGVVDYTTGILMCRVASVYKYDETYRVFAEVPCYYLNGVHGVGSVALPSVIVFSASSASSYPTAVADVSFNNSAITDRWD